MQFTTEGPIPLESRKFRIQCEVRWPSDDEWKEAQRRITIRTIPTGKPGHTRTETLSTAAYHDLFLKVRTGQEQDLDPETAEYFMERLAHAIASRPVPNGDGFHVELQVFKALTLHKLKMPSIKQIKQFQRTELFVERAGRSGRTEYRANLAAGEELYDALLDDAPDGYATASKIPVIHKYAVAAELAAYLTEDESEGSDDPT